MLVLVLKTFQLNIMWRFYSNDIAVILSGVDSRGSSGLHDWHEPVLCIHWFAGNASLVMLKNWTFLDDLITNQSVMVINRFSVNCGLSFVVNCSCMKLQNQRTKIISPTVHLRLQSLAKQTRLKMFTELTGTVINICPEIVAERSVNANLVHTKYTLLFVCVCSSHPYTVFPRPDSTNYHDHYVTTHVADYKPFWRSMSAVPAQTKPVWLHCIIV